VAPLPIDDDRNVPEDVGLVAGAFGWPALFPTFTGVSLAGLLVACEVVLAWWVPEPATR